MLVTHTGPEPYLCSNCDKRFSVINLQFNGVKNKFIDCNELLISKTNQMLKMFTILMSSVGYIGIIFNKLCMSFAAHWAKAVLMHDMWMGPYKCLFKSVYQSNRIQAWSINISMCRSPMRCVYHYKLLKVYHKGSPLYFKYKLLYISFILIWEDLLSEGKTYQCCDCYKVLAGTSSGGTFRLGKLPTLAFHRPNLNCS